MLGQATIYALRRVTSRAVEHATREAIWISISALLVLAAFVFALIAAYSLAQPYLGSTKAAGLVALCCGIVGIACFFMPSFMERGRTSGLPKGVTPLSVANDEVKAAVDFFGPLRLVASAFAFGLGLARRLRRKSIVRREAELAHAPAPMGPPPYLDQWN